MAYKKHDFIEIEYTGKLEDGKVFDTTDEKIAKEYGLGSENAVFGPAIICMGENHILPGIEKELTKVGSFVVKLDAEHAFGKKDSKLLKLMPMKVFRKQEIQPFIGLEVNIDNMHGIVRSVSGGRVIVDFNHPLSSRNVEYDVKVLRQITDTFEKAKSMFKNELNISEDILELKTKTLLIKEEKFPKEIVENVKKRIMEVIPEIKDVMLAKDYKPKPATKPVAKKPAKPAETKAV